MMRWVIFILLASVTNCDDSLELISKTRTSYLQKYGGYVDVVILHMEVPPDSSLASFKFLSDETRMSMFGCSPRKVCISMKENSLPVINPDSSDYPTSFKNITRSELYNLDLMSDKSVKYLNLTSPDPGSYFIAAFLPYSDPKYDSIQPPGLTPQCFANVDVSLYVKRQQPSPEQIIPDNSYSVNIPVNTKSLYKFFVPKLVPHALLIVEGIEFSNMDNYLSIRIQSRRIPSIDDGAIKSEIINATSNITSSMITFNTIEDNWHFVDFRFGGVDVPNSDNNSLKFSFRYFPDKYDTNDEIDNNNTVLSRVYRSEFMPNIVPYKQYDLVRESSTESFSYSYELRKKFYIATPSVPVNLTSDEFVVLKFHVRQYTDIGGTLQFIMAFKPRVNLASKVLEKEPENHRVIACIRPDDVEFPDWPNRCIYGSTNNEAPLQLNKTTDNATIMIPYPESGVWYASLKLSCGNCQPCNCSNECQKEFEACMISCETTCQNEDSCSNCSLDCKGEVVNKAGCDKCDCNGACLRDQAVCNSSIIFDISSTSCTNNCGKNGRCMFMVCDGIVYSTCVCSNNYRGWDCSDDSHATAYYMVVLELLLLVFSNLMFLPTVFIAYKRKYYVEAVAYFSILFFSTFYHACDAGENIISFCITRLSPLQFADFYCALLAIWVTLIAIADLPSNWPTICQMTGAIILAFTTTINKTALWAFILPTSSGFVIIAISWFFKWKKVRQMFLNRRYLFVYIPIGVVLVTLGLVIYALLQTTDNYKYLHSMWHVIMAISVIILLPRPNTFQPETML